MRIKVKSHFRLAFFVILLVTLAFAAGWRVASSAAVCAELDNGLRAADAAGVRGAQLIVGPGDSLWSIATQSAPPGVDPRLAVYQLRQSNKLSSATLRVGQVLLIPPSWLAEGGNVASVR